MQYTFFVLASEQEEVLEWCREMMPPHVGARKWNRFAWFPFYNIKGSKAFRIDILLPNDALAFKLRWKTLTTFDNI